MSITYPGSGGGFGISYPTVYPETYGAKGDGITDDTAAIQAAINAVSTGLGYNAASITPTLAAGIGTVVLGPKVYKITSALTIASSYVRIQGAGIRSTIILQATAGADIIDVNGTGNTSTTAASMVYLTGFAVMRGIAFTGTPSGIKLNYCYWATIDHVESWDSYNCFYVTNSASHLNMYVCNAISSYSPRVNAGFYFNGSQISSYIVNCVATVINGAMTYGAFLNGPGSDLFISQFETAVNNEGIYVSGVWSDLFILDPVLESGSYGIHVVSSTGIIQIRGGYYSGNSPGIWMENSKNVQIVGGMFQGGGANYASIYISGTSGNNSVVGGTFRITSGVSSGAAIVVDAGGLNILSNNTITTPSAPAAGYGINLRNSTVHNAVNGNTIGGYFTNGIAASAGSNNNSIVGNVIDPANVTTPIADSGTGNLLSNVTT